MQSSPAFIVDSDSNACKHLQRRFQALGAFKAGDLFELGTVLALNTGMPYTLITGRDDNNDGRASDRAPGAPRNSAQGFGAANLDVRLSREFKLTRSDKDEAPGLDASLEACVCKYEWSSSFDLTAVMMLRFRQLE
jgi:hypothetical protein